MDNLTTGLSWLKQVTKVIMTTDASLQAWGTHCNGKEVQDPWTSQQAKMHMNVLELWATWMALKVYLPFLRRKEVWY